MRNRITLLIAVSFIYNFGFAQQIEEKKATFKQKPIVEMTLNDKKVWVLLDTGTEINILNINEKSEFGFKTFLNNDTRYNVPGFGSENNQLHQVGKADLRFGSTRLNRGFYAYDISNITDSIKRRTGKNVTAILGSKTMRDYGFVIDMGDNTVTMKSKYNNSEISLASQTK
jgi:hypothetical protein